MSQNSDSHRVVIRRNQRSEISESMMAINKKLPAIEKVGIEIPPARITFKKSLLELSIINIIVN